MIREIPLQGISTVPSDYECQDGQSALAVNLIPEDGVLRPAAPGKTIADLEAGERAVWVHANVTWRHMITTDGTNLYWRLITGDEVGDPDHISEWDKDGRESKVLKVSSVGNTLVVLCDDGVWYYLWRPDYNRYFCLGQKPPELRLQFGLGKNIQVSDDSNPEDDSNFIDKFRKNLRKTEYKVTEVANTWGLKDEYVDEMNNQIWGLLNKYNALVSKKGYFYAPFFVRYCYRLYDGSQFMHSAPVFMPVSVPETYQVYLYGWGLGKSDDSSFNVLKKINDSVSDYATFGMVEHSVPLEVCNISGDEVVSALREVWKDIIKSVDIFVSLPITTADTSEKINKFTDRDYDWGISMGKIKYWKYPGDSTGTYYGIRLEVPQKTAGSGFYKQVMGCGTYYKVYSYDLERDTIPDEMAEVPIATQTGSLANLSTFEAMTDDYHTHNVMLPLGGDSPATSLFSYNSRLNVSAFKERLFPGFMPWQLVPECNGFFTQGRKSEASTGSDATTDDGTTTGTDASGGTGTIGGGGSTGGTGTGSGSGDNSGTGTNNEDNDTSTGPAYITVKSVWVFLHTDDGDMKVAVFDGDTKILSQIIYVCPMFYPDSRAYKMVLTGTDPDGASICIELPMRAHDLLNGAVTEYHTSRWSETEGAPVYHITTSDVEINGENLAGITEVNDAETSSPNIIATSEANNPFYFPATGYNRAGTGTVLGLSSAVRALSQGQFGQYPLYAFCTDGVWALMTTTQGTYNAVQPVTRDVCTDPESITQIDQAVLFVTRRGIMEISGATTQCISEPLGGVNILSPAVLGVVRGVASAPVADIEVQDFADWVQGCRMLYDYPRQRIIAYKAGTGYAYVYSLKSKQWGMMQDDTTYGLNSYPDAWAVRVVGDKSQLVNVSQRGAGSWESVLVTRPLKLGDLNALKTVRAVITRGFFRHSHVRSVLVGSRDLMHWSVVWSSETHVMRGFSGTPYKYYRLILDCRLDADESLTSCSVLVEPRMANRLR